MADSPLFKYLNSITQGNANLLHHAPDTDLNEYRNLYIPIIKGLSMNNDTILFADMVNQLGWDVQPQIHYGILFETIKKKKRYSKWAKGDQITDDHKLVMWYYECGLEESKQYMKILTEEQLAVIKNKHKFAHGELRK